MNKIKEIILNKRDFLSTLELITSTQHEEFVQQVRNALETQENVPIQITKPIKIISEEIKVYNK